MKKVIPQIGMGMSAGVPQQPPSLEDVQKIESSENESRNTFNPIMKLNIAAAKKIASKVD